MTISNPLYVYLQRPDTGAWLTVGRYRLDAGKDMGHFRYAPSYLEAGFSWSIDPINLPLSAYPIPAHRYEGLHDVLRDTCPDSWGRALIQREYGLSDSAHPSAYLLQSNNAERWGALAIGKSPKPSITALSTPKLEQLSTLSEELLAMYERRPPISASLRKRLMATPSLGGARPKATVRDGDECWLVKPLLPSDTIDIPLLEHVVQRWGQAAKMCFARTEHESFGNVLSLSVIRSRRFDRTGDRRFMTLSAASLLRTEYPGDAGSAAWSYPVLASVLYQIGAPLEDRVELFNRMIFNAVIGNDDDHPRNHAAIYNQEEGRWRLAPAFDVVPNPDCSPTHLAMRLSTDDAIINRANSLASHIAFGFESDDQAAHHLDALLLRIQNGFSEVEPLLTDGLRDLMARRLKDGLKALTTRHTP